MSPDRPSSPTLFKFTFSHLPEPPDTPEGPSAAPFLDKRNIEEQKLKIFGFFDILRVEEQGGAVIAAPNGTATAPDPHLAPNEDPEQVSGDRQQRTLLAFGDSSRVEELIKRGRDLEHPAYIAICLVKLAGKSAHGKFDTFIQETIATREPDIVYLGCLDSPDLIILRSFGGRHDSRPRPLENLIAWMEEQFRMGPLAGKVERSLTMVACRDAETFDKKLAPADKDSTARALVRVTDMRNGVALKELCEKLINDGEFKAIPTELKTSVGYYDVQAVISLPAAARLLNLAAPMVVARQLMTSTCFLGQHKPGDLVEAVKEDSPLLDSLLQEWKKLDAELEWRRKEKCLKFSTRAVAAEAVSRFRRLHSTGFIPGSRLLIWTCRDALETFAQECADHRTRRSGKPAQAQTHDSEFYMRQLAYGEFFRAVCDELDRRVSLSLVAHTRFFPCSIEVPLKLVGALDTLGRLMAASFRCYRCRQEAGLLQVFTARSDNPSEYRYYPGTYLFASGAPVPTIMFMTFSPRMARHFYLAMFMVMHEVAQCVFVETIAWPSFSAIVMSHAFVERMAVIGTLASLRPDATSQDEVPKFVHQWTARFLAQEVLDESWWFEKTRVGPEYFAPTDVPIPEHLEPTGPDQVKGYVWQTQVLQWRVGHANPKDKAGVMECYQLFRDARSFPNLTKALSDPGFLQIWRQELLVQLGALPEEIAAGAKDAQGRPMTYQGKLGDIADAITRWSAACDWEEYIELASFIPVLRLFETEDDQGHDLAETISGLACDYAEVWRDTESPSSAYDSARRFLVALAAMDVFRSHQRKEGIDDPSLGKKADQLIAAALRRSATILQACLPRMIPGHAQDACKAVWDFVADPKAQPLTPSFAYGREVAQPMIIHAMVRFLVRLVHVYSINGPNLLPGQAPAMRALNGKVRHILAARQEHAHRRIPVHYVAELWALQYRLSEMSPKANYRFPLGAAIAAADWSTE